MCIEKQTIPPSQRMEDLISILDVLKALSSRHDAHEISFAFVEQVARILSVDRCSLVRVRDGQDEGHVLVSHENENFRDYVIELEKYPELITASQTGNVLIIDDETGHPLAQEVRGMLQQAGMASLFVFPLLRQNTGADTLMLRVARRHGTFTPRERSFLQTITEITAAMIGQAYLLESLQAANRHLEQLAITDGLTGVYNRRYFQERFEHEFARALRYHLPFSCVLFDIDDFKEINDTYGHLVGDEILKEVVELMIVCTRHVDILARYGGEEFVILLPQTNVQGALIEAERMREHMETHVFSKLPEDKKITISVGVAGLDPEIMNVSNDLLHAADLALYEAKSNGKNRVVVNENLKKE